MPERYNVLFVLISIIWNVLVLILKTSVILNWIDLHGIAVIVSQRTWWTFHIWSEQFGFRAWNYWGFISKAVQPVWNKQWWNLLPTMWYGFRIQDSGFLYFQHNIITNKQYILTKKYSRCSNHQRNVQSDCAKNTKSLYSYRNNRTINLIHNNNKKIATLKYIVYNANKPKKRLSEHV